MTPIYRKGRKEYPGIYRSVSQILVPGKVVVKTVMKGIMKENQMTSHSITGFMKGWSCLTSLISCDKRTHLLDEGKAVDAVYLDFIKMFDTGSESILEKLSACGLDRCTVHWVRN